MRISYRRDDSTFNTEMWSELRDLDYKESPDDRDVKEFGARLDYKVSALITTGIFGSYNRTKETDNRRKDKTYVLRGNAGYSLSPKLSANFDLQYQNRDSNRTVR